MVSIKGPALKIVAAIVGLAALIFGVYSTFFMSSGYETTTATIVSIEEDPRLHSRPELRKRRAVYRFGKIYG